MANLDAEKEWQALLDENSNKYFERGKILKEKGIKGTLDGENHYKDIDEWFEKEMAAIKKKYGLS